MALLCFVSHDMSSRACAFKTFADISVANVSHKTKIKIEGGRKYIPPFNGGSVSVMWHWYECKEGERVKAVMQQIYLQG